MNEAQNIPHRHRTEVEFSRWLAERLGVSGLIATPVAPTEIPAAEEVPGLCAFLGQLPAGTWTRAPEQLYQAVMRLAPAVAAQKERLRRQEGLPPSAKAVLLASDSLSTRDLSRKVAQAGFQTGTGGEGLFLHPASLMESGPTPDTVTLGAATGWKAFFRFVARRKLLTRPDLTALYRTPFEAAGAGAFGGWHPDQSQSDICTITLPPDSWRTEQAVWLFPDENRALTALQRLSRDFAPAHLALYDANLLEAGNAAGLWSLPGRVTGRTALHVTLIGPAFAARANALAAGMAMRNAGGRFWRAQPLAALELLDQAALGSGAVPVLDERPFTLSQENAGLKDCRERWWRRALTLGQPVVAAASLQGPPQALSLKRRLFARRDFTNVVEQWAQLAAAAGEAPAQPRPPRRKADETEASDEWQAIRNSLLAPDGSPRLPSDMPDPASGDGIKHMPSSRQYG